MGSNGDQMPDARLAKARASLEPKWVYRPAALCERCGSIHGSNVISPEVHMHGIVMDGARQLADHIDRMALDAAYRDMGWL